MPGRVLLLFIAADILHAREREGALKVRGLLIPEEKIR